MRTFFSSFVVVLLLVVLVGCGSTETVSREQVRKPDVKAVPTAKVAPVIQEQQSPALTAEQIPRSEQIFLNVEIVRLAHKGGANKSLPKWVADHYEAYEVREYSRGKVAFQRSVGWGTGTYKGKLFHWFAYTNTDAFLQFDFSVAMTGTDDLGKIIGGRQDAYGRFREAALPSGSRDEGFLPETRTWIGDTNDWTDANCASPKYDPCDLSAALEKSVADLNKDLPGLNLIIKGKFPW